jgi:RNA polymerase-binding transcription factor DksA
MTQLLSNETNPTAEAPVRGLEARWLRLHEERLFRLEQLAALDAEPPLSERHEDVRRALRIAAGSALDEIDAALQRIAEGRYGVCVHCEQVIAAERLDVLPATPLCMGCHYNEQNCRLATG